MTKGKANRGLQFCETTLMLTDIAIRDETVLRCPQESHEDIHQW